MVYTLERAVTTPNEPVIYYLRDCPRNEACHVRLNWLSVNPIGQHPALVIICA